MGDNGQSGGGLLGSLLVAVAVAVVASVHF